MLTALKRIVLRVIRAAGYDLRKRSQYEGFDEREIGRPRRLLSRRIEVLPISDIPCPTVALGQVANPVQAILSAAEFPATSAYFHNNPAAERSLVSPDSQALLFSLVRNLKPDRVVEIGSFRCGTAEAICRALHANGAGELHTVDPFGAQTVPAILDCWPDELRRRVRFTSENSAYFFHEMQKRGLRADLVFVDGNHDYEYALFDIQCAARHIVPGGFICVDNISQAGPFFAGVDFLKANPDWTECGDSATRFNVAKAFDRDRTSIRNTDMMVLRAPATLLVGQRPMTPGEQPWRSNTVHGLRLSLASGNGPGVLHVQCVVRGFGAAQVEVTGEATVTLDDRAETAVVRFGPPIALQGTFELIRVEPWLTWVGQTPLRLLEAPAID